MTQRLLEPDTAHFEREIQRLIADGEDTALFTLAGEVRDTVAPLLGGTIDDLADVPVAVSNAAALAAICARRGKVGIVEAVIDALLATYRLADVQSDTANDIDIQLFEAMAGSLEALGAVLVQLELWTVVRRLVDQEPVPGGHYRSWIRQAQVMASRRSTTEENVVKFGAERLRLHAGFGMTDATDIGRLAAVAMFDQAAAFVGADLDRTSGKRRSYFPNYAKYLTEWVEPLAIAMRPIDAPARQALFPHPDEEFIETLRTVNEVAISQAAMMRGRGLDWQYRGFGDARTWFYIVERGQIWEEFGFNDGDA